MASPSSWDPPSSPHEATLEVMKNFTSSPPTSRPIDLYIFVRLSGSESQVFPRSSLRFADIENAIVSGPLRSGISSTSQTTRSRTQCRRRGGSCAGDVEGGAPDGLGGRGAQVPLAETLTAPQPSTFPDARKISLRRSPLGRRADDMGSPDPEISGEVPAAAGPAQLP